MSLHLWLCQGCVRWCRKISCSRTTPSSASAPPGEIKYSVKILWATEKPPLVDLQQTGRLRWTLTPKVDSWKEACSKNWWTYFKKNGLETCKCFINNSIWNRNLLCGLYCRFLYVFDLLQLVPTKDRNLFLFLYLQSDQLASATQQIKNADVAIDNEIA